MKELPDTQYLTLSLLLGGSSPCSLDSVWLVSWRFSTGLLLDYPGDYLIHIAIFSTKISILAYLSLLK